ncbi:MAG: hypothetical protein RL095_3053 [Verrucomicrobiota bacterium]|jgi:hypothetical protein
MSYFVSFSRASFLTLALTCASATLSAEEQAAPAAAKEAAKPQAPAAVFARFEPKELGKVEFKPQALRAPCKIDKILAKDGDVAQDAPILQLKCEELEAAQTAARNAVEQARIALTGAENEARFASQQAAFTLADAETSLARARLALSQFIEVEKPSALTEAKARLDDSEASLEDARAEYEQLKKMYEGSKVEGETRELVLKRAARRLANGDVMLGMARIRYKQTIEIGIPDREKDLKSAAAKAELNLERTKAGLAQQAAMAPFGLAKAKLDLLNAEKSLTKFSQEVAALTLRASAAGSLVGLDVKEGADAAPGVYGRIYDLRKGLVRWEVPLAQAADYAPGTKLAVEIPELQLKLEGRVVRLSSAGRPAGPSATTLTAELELSSENDLVPGIAVKIAAPAAQDKR